MSTLLDQYNGDTPDTPTCFPLVHFYQHLFLYDKNSNLIFSMVSTYHGSNYQGSKSNDGVIELTYQFSNQSSPSSTQITIHNLTKRNADKFKKGNTISIWAGWEDSDRLYNNIAQIFKSTISTVNPLQDSSGDWILSVTCEDGQKFDNETALSKLYKSESKSVRSDASGSGDISAERTALKQIEKVFRSRENLLRGKSKSLERWFHKNSAYLTSKGHTITQKDKRLEAEEKVARAKARAAYPSVRSNGKHGKAGNGSSKTNSTRAHERKEAGKQVTREFNALKNALKVQRSIIKAKRQHNTKVRRHKAHSIQLKRQDNSRTRRHKEKHIRTVYGAKRERVRRAKTKRKTKAKKTKSNGLHFKKNTEASTIIRRLAKIGHIPISRLNLIHDKTYHSGYTATGKPFAEIQNVVSDCDSNIWWPHGKLVIGNFANHHRENFTLTPDTGLVQPPEPEDDDDSDDNDDSSTKPKNKKQQKQLQEAVPTKYDVTSIFLPFLTTGSEFQIMDPGSDMLAIQRNDDSNDINAGDLFQGEVVVISGELDIEAGSMPESQFTVEYASAVQKAQSIKNKTKAQKLAQQKAAKDKKRRHRVKLKRHARRAKRVRAKKPRMSKRK